MAQFRHLALISHCFPLIEINSLLSDSKVVKGHLIASKMNFTTYISCLRSSLVISTTFEYLLSIFTSLQNSQAFGPLTANQASEMRRKPIVIIWMVTKWPLNRFYRHLWCDFVMLENRWVFEMPPVEPKKVSFLAIFFTFFPGRII